MSLEGRLRELALPEVLQLLGVSRKSGTLHLVAPVQGRAAFVRLTNGSVVDAAQWRIEDRADERAGESDGAASRGLAGAGASSVERCVLDLLTWRDGDFRFEPAEGALAPSPVRLSVDMLLVESAQRAEAWSRLEDRVPHAHVVPAFVDVEPQQLPLLRLEPQQWEILTRVDGQRDLTEVATLLGRDLIDVAELVHGLIGAGLLTLRESETAPRRNPTPPIGTSAQPTPAGTDLWVPHGAELLDGSDAGSFDDDSLFDPVELGMQLADGMPRRRTTPRGTPIVPSPVAAPAVVAVSSEVGTGVAPAVAETSLLRGETSWPLPGMDASALCAHGDDAARRGDLAGALTFWSAALRSEASLADADRIREAIALAARLHALLHPAARRT